MGLSKEDIRRRNEATVGIRTFEPKDDKDYVFISYKSDNWEIVLDEIVRKLVDKYGLRVYFDKNFDRDNESWVTNMEDAIRTQKCKAILSFVSKEYMESYACLMELLTARSKKAKSKHKKDRLTICPIIISEAKSINDLASTSSDRVEIKEWDDYSAIVENAFENDEWVKGDVKDSIGELLDNGSRATIEDISSAMESILDDKTHLRTYDGSDLFYENLVDSLKKESDTIFEEIKPVKVEKETPIVEKETPKKTETKVAPIVEEAKIYHLSTRTGNIDVTFQVVENGFIVKQGSKIHEAQFTPKKIMKANIDKISHGVLTGDICIDGDEGVLSRFIAGSDNYKAQIRSMVADNSDNTNVSKPVEQEKESKETIGETKVGDHSVIDDKSAAKEFLAKKGVRISNKLTYAAYNERTDGFWANPKPDNLKEEWTLILNNKITGKLVVLIVPPNSIGLESENVNGLKIRRDRPVIDLVISDDGEYTDKRSKVSFKPFVVAQYSYSGDEKPEGRQDGSMRRGEIDYYVYGEKHSGDQSDLMFDTIEAVLTRHPDICDRAVQKCTCLAYGDDIYSPEGTLVPYFRGKREITVNGKKVYIGSSYGLDAKKTQMRYVINLAQEKITDVVRIDSEDPRYRFG